MNIPNGTIDLSNVAINYIKKNCYHHYMISHTSVNRSLSLRNNQITEFVNKNYFRVHGFRNI